MRIYSDFHDYYDIGLSYGIDPKIIYSRKTISYTWQSEVGKEILKAIDFKIL